MGGDNHAARTIASENDDYQFTSSKIRCYFVLKRTLRFLPPILYLHSLVSQAWSNIGNVQSYSEDVCMEESNEQPYQQCPCNTCILIAWVRGHAIRQLRYCTSVQKYFPSQRREKYCTQVQYVSSHCTARIFVENIAARKSSV